MQPIFAAMGAAQMLFVWPFLLAAAFAFTILVAIRSWRRWAIPILTGLLASGPFLFAGMGSVLLVNHFLGYDARPEPRILLVCLSVGIPAGLLGGVTAGILARLLTGILPRLLLRWAIVVVAGYSYFAVLIVLNIAASARWPLPDSVPKLTTLFLAEAVLALVGAWFTARNPEPFRGSRFRLPIGLRFRQRGGQPPACR